MHLSLLPVASRDELQASVPTLLPCAAMSLTRSPRVTSQICTLPELVPTAMWLPRWAQQMSHSLHPLLESGILLTAVAAVTLNLFFNGTRGVPAASHEEHGGMEHSVAQVSKA
jgi:xanthine/uracil permease